MMKQKTMIFALALAASLAYANPEFYGVPVPSQQECAQMGYMPMHQGDSLNLSNGAQLLNDGVWLFFGSVYASFSGYTPDHQRLVVPFMGERAANLSYPGGFEASISACGLPYYPDGSVYDLNNRVCTENCSVYVKLAEVNPHVLGISGHTYRYGGGHACEPYAGIRNCISVTAPNVTIDCNGSTISSSLETPMVAIYSNQAGTVVKNCRFKGFAGGIHIENASGSALENNTFENEVNSMHESVRFAIQANSSTGIVVANNTVLLMDHGIIAEDQGLTLFTSIVENGVNDSSFYGNDLDPSLAGIYALESHGNSFTANKARGLLLSGSSSTSITGNTFSFVPVSPLTIDINGTAYRTGGWAQIFLVRSSGNAVSGNIVGLGNSWESGFITLYLSDGNIVANNSIPNGGMTFSASSGNLVFGNNATQGYEYYNTLEIGTTINSSTGNVFSGNNLSSKSASRPVIFTASCTDPDGNPSVSQAANNTFFHNDISGALWVAEECPLPLNNYSFEGQGNAYYLPNGTPSWGVYDIVDTNNDSYADVGHGLPFTQSTVGAYWHGPSEDAHPYTLKHGAPLEISGNASTAANQTSEEQPPAPPSEAASLPQANAAPAAPTNSSGTASPQDERLDRILALLEEIRDFLFGIFGK
ncbi:MAG: NosD domain-containing protein [Candidatus Micrarchaeia archaeon]|jgi:hypothetical protein